MKAITYDTSLIFQESARREADAGKLRRCIAGGGETSSLPWPCGPRGCPCSPQMRFLRPSFPISAASTRRRGGRDGLCTTRDAAAQLACVDLSLPKDRCLKGRGRVEARLCRQRRAEALPSACLSPSHRPSPSPLAPPFKITTHLRGMRM
jgi:hypothetical protein